VSGPGNFLFDLGTGNGTLPRAPGVGVDNHDVVYQFDGDPSLSGAEQAFNDGVVRVTADPQARAGGLRQVPQVSATSRSRCSPCTTWAICSCPS
jgi:hypothetical protein